MYEAYLTIGIFLLIVDLIVVTFSVYFLYIKKHMQPTVLSILQVLSTISVGLLYTYSATTMMKTETEITSPDIPMVDVTLENHYTIEPILNETNEDDYMNNFNKNQDFLIKYQEFLKKNLNTTNQSSTIKRTKREGVNLENQLQHNCTSKTIFLQHAMLVYSFLHGLVSLLNAAFNCKECIKNDTTTLSAKKIPISPKLFTWLTPTIFTAILYFIMQDQKGNNLLEQPVQQFISKAVLNPTNVSTVAEENLVNKIITNVYHIIETANKSSNLLKTSLIINQNGVEKCYYPTVTIKIYMFIIFVLGLFTIVLYAQTIYIQSLATNSRKAKKLKLSLIGFNVLWLPSVLEVLERSFFTYTSPDRVTELLLVFGNLNHILMDISNAITSRKSVNNENHVQPIDHHEST